MIQGEGGDEKRSLKNKVTEMCVSVCAALPPSIHVQPQWNRKRSPLYSAYPVACGDLAQPKQSHRIPASRIQMPIMV